MNSENMDIILEQVSTNIVKRIDMNDSFELIKKYKDLKEIADLIDDVNRLREYFSAEQ